MKKVKTMSVGSSKVSKYQASPEEQAEFAQNYGSELIFQIPGATGSQMSTGNSYHLRKFEDLADFCLSDGRVCPLTEFWITFCELITPLGAEQSPPSPLSEWSGTYDSTRKERLIQQLAYALSNGTLDTADRYLRGLSLEQWMIDLWSSYDNKIK